MSNVKTIIELENSLTKDEQEKLLNFIEREFGCTKEYTKIFDTSNYVSQSEFANEIYEKMHKIMIEDFSEY